MSKRVVLNPGDRYGRLRVIKEVERSSGAYKDRQFLCRCDCSEKKVVRMNQLRTGKTESCGCLRIEKISEANSKNLKDATFGYLTVIERAEIGADPAGVLWRCKCRCGNEKNVVTEHLISGAIVSCGCRRKETGEKVQDFIEENHRVDGVRTTSLKRKNGKNNTSGVKGVSEFKTKTGVKYRVFIGLKNKNIYLGSYDTLEEAVAVRKLAEEKYHQPYLDTQKRRDKS